MIRAEQPLQAETESTVPELIAFHDVIFPIWHDAYPRKNYVALRGYAAQIQERFAGLEKARLPGILRDKQAAWDRGLAQMKAAVESYTRSAAAKDDQALLKAAETLHTRYEAMVRIIRPANKEVDGFHKLLYVIYHQYLPGRQYSQIRKSVPDLKAAAAALPDSQLPRRLEGRRGEFRAVATRLIEEVRRLESACASDQGTVIEQAVEAVHSAYVEMNSLFE